jgi:hypothetical protein
MNQPGFFLGLHSNTGINLTGDKPTLNLDLFFFSGNYIEVLDAFKLWTWRRLLRIPWTARRMNALVINQIKPRHSLETLAVIGKLKYFGHIMRTSDSLEKDLMLGLTDGSRRRGKQRTKWIDEIRRTMTP